ncbi:hypothetical protein ACIGW7_17535 [Streptomyces sp. NPDC053253]|uniref:hypothetical protein n=1 Tax=Streptomyces sp. NPDC053253 TaxID=3365699 RepID=UPI0037CCD0B8
MQQIQPPVTPASSPDAVRNLQGVLLFLLDLGEFEMEPERRIEVAAGLEAERAVPEYGVHTLRLVRLFQEKSGIQVATGEVDTPTALAMDRRLIRLGGVTAHPATATTLATATAGTEGPGTR